MRKTAATLITILLITTLAGPFFLGLGKANPYFYEKVTYPVSPPSDVNPPSISISSPENEEVQISNNLSLNFNVTVVVPTLPELFYSGINLADVYYKASWLPNNTYLDLEGVNYSANRSRFYSEDNLAKWHTYWAISGYTLSPTFSVNLTEVPGGDQSVEVTAVLIGSSRAGSSEQAMTIYYGTYELRSSSKVNFMVTPLLSPQNKTYDSSDVPLLFRMHKSVKQVSYSLDGQDNVFVEGNTTLTRLPNGDHNITIYVTDNNGKSVVSETLFFIVDTPEVFPVVPLAIGFAVVAVAASFLLTRRKRQKEAQQI